MTFGHLGDFIAAEWGTAGLRAWLVRGGKAIDRVEQALKLAELGPAGIRTHLLDMSRHWPDVREVWLAGMIGSAQGLHEVDQLALPTTLRAVRAGTAELQVEHLRVHILPGLKCLNPFGEFDVLRGEEVSVLGAISKSSGNSPFLMACVPGMHGKWVRAEAGRVETFHTAMTVELMTLISRQSFLSPLFSSEPRIGPAFRHGVAKGAAGGSAARLLFGVRARYLAGELLAEDASSYGWGLMIGADCAEALTIHNVLGAEGRVIVYGPADRVALYECALEELGAAPIRMDINELPVTGFCAVKAAENVDAS